MNFLWFNEKNRQKKAKEKKSTYIYMYVCIENDGKEVVVFYRR